MLKEVTADGEAVELVKARLADLEEEDGADMILK